MFVLAWIARILQVIEDEVFSSNFHEFNMCFLTCALHKQAKHFKSPLGLRLVAICLRQTTRHAETSSYRIHPPWTCHLQRGPTLNKGFSRIVSKSYRHLIAIVP
jgi:hypothetical protein